MLELRKKNLEREPDCLRVVRACPASHDLESWDQETCRGLVQVCLKEANHVFEMSSWSEWKKWFSNAEGLKELLTNSKSHLTTLFISLSPRVLNWFPNEISQLVQLGTVQSSSSVHQRRGDCVVWGKAAVGITVSESQWSSHLGH